MGVQVSLSSAFTREELQAAADAAAAFPPGYGYYFHAPTGEG
jgi:hypothetical protein